MKRLGFLLVAILAAAFAAFPGHSTSAEAPELTISGLVQHVNESSNTVPSRHIKVEAWERQALFDYKIAEGYTDDTGQFTFTHDTGGARIRNEDSGIGESGTRDIFIKIFAENDAARVSRELIGDLLGITWWGETDTDYDVAGPVYAVTITADGENSPALGIPSLVKADRDWLASRASGWNRGQLGILYPSSDWPHFCTFAVFERMEIPGPNGERWADDEETISHEYGHAVHDTARGSLLPLCGIPIWLLPPADEQAGGCDPHCLWSESSGQFALSEGWAEFFAAARHDDPSGLETNDYWMGHDGNYAAGPNTDGTPGEIVEGAFASILWDLYDGRNDDSVAGGFADLWTVFLNDDPDRVWSATGNDDFYHYWIGRFGQSRAVDEIFIDHGIKVGDDAYDIGGGNDSAANATSLGTVGSVTLRDLISTDMDWYQFTLPDTASPESKVTISFLSSRGDLDLLVYEADGSTLVNPTESSGDCETVSLAGKPEGTYKVKVVGHGDNASTPGTYEGDFSPNYTLHVNPEGTGCPVPGSVDVALVIDSSGSMSWNDPANKRLDAAKAYLTASLEGDFVGVVDFDSGVRVASPLQRLPDNKTSLINAINTINSSGGTNIGNGVQAGCNVLIASTSGNATKAAILLTDGQGSFSGQDSCFKDRGWPIYTFGFGSANDALLQQIASNTGGEFARLPTTDLVCEFQRVRSLIAGETPGPCTATQVNPGQTVTVLAAVAVGQAQATFSSSWTGSDVEMSLIEPGPDGRVINRDNWSSFPDVAHDLGATFELYSITSPTSGDWQVNLFGANVPPGGEDVIFGFTTIPTVGDSTPPTTMISPDPASPDGENGWYVSPVTVTLTAEDDPGGSGVASTEYRLNGGSWQPYAGPFTLSTDGSATVEARSTDNAGNVEDPPASATVQIDQTGPAVNVEVPAEGVAVQDGVTLAASANDATSGIADVRLYVREDDGGTGIDVGFESLPATYNLGTGHWEYAFDSTALPDGYYVALAEAEDNAGNEAWSEIRHFSIRNWAVVELLPASESNKAGRTMPVKFSLRIAAAVDPAQPFVYNEDLTIKVFETTQPANVLQTSTYGDTARDYRIDQVGELYITNFKTLKRPKDYSVEIWRYNTLEFLVGDFAFSTVK